MNTKQAKVTFDSVEHNSPPWPEWSDLYLNGVQWGRPNKHSTLSQMSPISRTRTVTETDDPFYEDPAGLLMMPPEIEVHSWRRPPQINFDTSYVIEPDPTPLDLVTYNKHLFSSEVMRTIITGIACLEREGFYRPFPVEFQSDLFVANCEAEWKPWHHVYALTMAGKGQIHNPQVNPYGKYIVRLFFLGKWRRVLVDDKLPINGQGQVLLPVTRPDNLWLPLLAKALLKVASISQVVDFSVIHCLTGWIPTIVPCKDCNVYLLWCVCCQLMPTTEEVVMSPGCCKGYPRFPAEATGNSAVESRAILAVITSKMASTSLLKGVLIANVRYDSEQPSPLWKQHRWNEWAFNKGIISEIPYKPVRNVEIFDPLTENPKPSVEFNSDTQSGTWLDFDDFVQYIRNFIVYFKPSYFKYSLRAWNAQEILSPPQIAEDVVKRRTTLIRGGDGDAKSTKTKTGNTEKSEKSTNQTSKQASSKGSKGKSNKGKAEEDEGKVKDDWPKNVGKPYFFYCLMDSMESTEVLCSVSTYCPERPHAIIFIGKFEWYSPSVAPIINRLSTSYISARFIIMEPGLKAFRIWYQLPTHFCLQIFSNAPFQTGTKMSIQQNLSFDSVTYKFYGKEISSSVEQLLAAPQGGASHGEAFQQVMRSLEPPQLDAQLPWPEWFRVQVQITEVFEDSLTEILIESIHHPEEVYQTIQAFQLLFLNPVFGMRKLALIKPEVYKYIMEQKEMQRQKELLLDKDLREQEAQALEQKGKKGANDKSKKLIDSPKTEITKAKTEKTDSKKDKNKRKSITEGEQLKKLIQCKEKSLLINDPNQAILLFRKMMSKMGHIEHLYPFSSEDNMKLVYKEYTGEVNVADHWVVLVYSVFNIHSLTPKPCSLHIWSPVEGLVLRLIDNDTNEEVFHLGFVENNVAHLTRNKGGYTVCAYGVASHTRPVPWHLRSLGLHEVDCLHQCECVDRCTNSHTQPAELSQQTLNGYYVPNKQNLIASCLLEVTTDVTVLLRLHLSYKYVVADLSVTDEDGNVVKNTTGFGQVLLITLHLKGREGVAEESPVCGDPRMSPEPRSSKNSNKPVIYRITAKVLKNSWPLETLQMRAMLYYKEHLPEILNRPFERKSQGRSGSNSERGLVRANSRDSQKKLTSSSLFEKSQTNKSSVDPEENFFENYENKPSWSLTLVTSLKKDTPVTLRLDTSLYDTMSELKKEWENKGFDSRKCESSRQDFLKKLAEESDDEFTEETVFKLKSKKLDKLTELYGQKISENQWQEKISRMDSLILPSTSLKSSTLSNLVASQSLDTDGEADQTLNTVPDKSRSQILHFSTVTTPVIPEASEVKLDHSNILVQQVEIHKALQSTREKTMDHIQQIFKETSELREKLINEMKTAKETELRAEKTEQDTKKGKKSKELSPTGAKGKKTSVKDSKKPKSGKGK